MTQSRGVADDPMQHYADPRVEIHAGATAIEHLAEIASRLEVDRVLVVTSPSFTDSNALARIRATLGDRLAGVFAGCQPLVPDTVVDIAIGMAKDVRAQLVVGLGGGSAIDTAKAVAVRLGEPGTWEELRVQVRADHTLNVPVLAGTRIPIVAIPSTPTGAEGTPSVSVNVTSEQRKISVLDRTARPGFVLHDAVLLAATPDHIAARAAMNGLANALESCYARPFSWFAAARPLIGAKLLGEGLDLLAEGSQAAGTRLLAGSYLAVVDFAESRSFETPRSGAVHAVAHALSGRFDVAHGDCYAALLPMGIRMNAEAASAILADFAAALGGEPGPEGAVARIDQWRTRFGLPRSLSDLAIPRDELPAVAAAAMQHFALVGNPRCITSAEEMLGLLEESW